MTGRCNVDEDYYSSAKIIWDNPKMHDVYYDEHLLLPEDKRFINGIGVQIYRMVYEGKLPALLDQPGLGDVILGKNEGRTSDDDRILFIAGGMVIWDLGWSYEMLENARKMGLGTSLNLWTDPYLA